MPDITPIAHIHSDFPAKFGIPRQSGLIEALDATISLEPPYNQPDAVRGLEGFSHIWLIWGFSQAKYDGVSATVRPPRLGGNQRMGVFATRSPFRPNSLGLSCVRLVKVDYDTPGGPVLHVQGADLLDGTPIYDIKPYLPYADSHPEAMGGFAEAVARTPLTVEFPQLLLAHIPEAKRKALLGILAHDPRPSYQDDPGRRYGMAFAGFDIKFTVDGGTLTVHDVVSLPVKGD